MSNAQKLTPEQEALVETVRSTTARVRELEEILEAARLERRTALVAAHAAGVTVYRLAQEAGTSTASTYRMINEFPADELRRRIDAGRSTE